MSFLFKVKKIYFCIYQMGDSMRKMIILLLGLLFLPLNIKASESIFIFGYDYIEVPYKADLNPYFDLVYNSIRLKDGYFDPNFRVEDENDGYFKSVINSNRLRTYKLKYKAYAPKYYKEETRFVEFRIVDKEPPIITHSEEIIYLLEGVKPNYETYITASDNETLSKDLKIEVNDFNVDYKNIGTYEVIYTIIDNSNNRTIHIENVHVLDKIKPIIIETELNKIQLGEPFYIEDHFIVTDNYDKHPHVSYEILGDINDVGYITINVTVTDKSGNTSNSSKRVLIVDEILPTLILTKSKIEIDVLSEPLDLTLFIGEIGKNLMVEDVIIIEDILYDKVGVYEVIYLLKDRHGNKTTEKLTVKVLDKEAPVIKAEDIVIDIEDEIDLKTGVYVEDNYSKNLKVNIYETNFKQEPGTYYVIYEVIDEAGNHTYHKRIITVRGKTKSQEIYLFAVGVVVVLSLGALGIFLYKKRKTI